MKLTHDVDQTLGFMIFAEMGGFSVAHDSTTLRFLLTRLENWTKETWKVVGREVEDEK